MTNTTKTSFRTMTFGSIITRIITAAIILATTAFLTPGFQISSLWTLALSAIVLTILDYLVSTIFNINIHPIGYGIVAFTVAALVLYATQFFIPSYYIGTISTLIGAFLYGTVAAIIPGR